MHNARLVCAACGWTPGPVLVEPYPFRCPHVGNDDGDHVVRVVKSDSAKVEASPHDNPFIRYRKHLYSWHIARKHGVSDDDYVAIVADLDGRVADVCGLGFRETPFALAADLGCVAEFAGDIWVKDETGNVAGSHKGRHFMGVAIYLKVVERIFGNTDSKPLAIASCGNAALAAAVVARAIERELRVFVPDHASPSVITELERLGATVCRCSRSEGVAGDPSYLAFRRAVLTGCIPFSCQGNENGLVIEGGSTLAYEMLDKAGDQLPDRIFVQVGGGALASACIQAVNEFRSSHRDVPMPRIHAVQTRGGYPLKRAYDRMVDRIFTLLGQQDASARIQFSNDDERSRYILKAAPPSLLDQAFAYARTHKSSFMWPWEEAPRSIAGGILDDETYDWAVVVEGMVRSGGFPIVVDEDTLEMANLIAREATGINVDHTGSSGLAGLLALNGSLSKPQPSERIAVLFTGVKR